MSRISNELRKVFLSQYKLGKKSKEIAQIIDVTVQTVNSWIRILKFKNEEELFKVNKSLVRNKRYTDEELREIFSKNQYAYNKTLGKELGLSHVMIHKYRVKLGFTYKRSTKSYKESNPELKKNSKKN